MSSPVPTLRDWVGVLDQLFDPSWAADWDRVGLVAGDPDAEVGRAHLAIDPTPQVVDEALDRGAGLLVTHHPLLLRGAHGVDESTPKGALLARLVRDRLALLTVHTNADVASPGVSDSLARVLGLADVRPLQPMPADAGNHVVVYVPPAARERLIGAMAEAGAGAIGDYAACHWSVEGTGGFTPLPGARPAVGEVGRAETVTEARVEMTVPVARLSAVLDAVRVAHPYEEPAYAVVPVRLPHARGLGRVGRLAGSMSAADFAVHAARVLPATTAGLRLAGDPSAPVRTVAVCGGAGDDLVDAALAAGADLLLTADLRHHVTAEAVERGLAMIDAGHWATEWPWLPDCADLTMQTMAARGHTVEVGVSSLVTDPWRASTH